MSKALVIDDNPPRKWLTIPEVCAYLKVSEAEWHTWRAAGYTPAHITAPDGQLMVRTFDLARWLDAHTFEPAYELAPADIAEFHAQRTRAAWRWLRRVVPGRSGRDGYR